VSVTLPLVGPADNVNVTENGVLETYPFGILLSKAFDAISAVLLSKLSCISALTDMPSDQTFPFLAKLIAPPQLPVS
jgi:hypothetical protein